MRHPKSRGSGLRVLVMAALALAAWTTNAGVAQAAEADPPTIRIRVANDLDDVALSQIRERVQADARLCRGLLHLPEAAPPPLPDAQLRKIVYFEDERLFRPDRLGHFSTQRSVQVDEASRCEPFVWVAHEASVTLGCQGQTVGIGRLALETWLPGIPRPAPKSPEVETLPASRLCPSRTEPISSAGAVLVDAGLGQKCAWMSALVHARLGALGGVAAATAADGPDLRPRHGDTCLLAGRTGYRSALLPASPIALMGHWTRPDDGPPDDGARQYLNGDTHLVQFEQGGKIADDEVSVERVKSFVEMSWREPLP